jgi:hypothetical protein
MGVLIGWLIADREHPVATVILFVICLVIWFWDATFGIRMLVASIDRPMFRPDLVMYFMTLFFHAAGLVGHVGCPRKAA